MKTVVVGMSGGVDSSVSAYLLKEAGYRVIGLFMKNWEDEQCPAAVDFQDVASVCRTLDIPYYAVNFVQEYRDRVFAKFLEESQKGRTPNPDILCNREIKFDLFFRKAKELGADYLATGHYARTENGALLKGIDPTKDQSYFLYALKEEILRQVLFPIGGLLKSEVRRLAREKRLVTHDKQDSTGICFVGERKFRQFLSTHLPFQAGNFCRLDGQVVGPHIGVAYYTIGQRKGLGLGGPGDAWFVVDKDPMRNIVFVEQGGLHPALFADGLIYSQSTWIQEVPSLSSYTCKIRYRQPDQPCQLVDDQTVTFPHPQRAITPGQSVVFYKGDQCLGGAVIESPFSSYYTLGKSLPTTLGTLSW